MEKQGFFINRANLEYGVSGQTISNYFDEEQVDAHIEIPSVFYLNLKYEEEIYLPITIFQNKLTPLQIIVKHLKENLKKTNKQIALILNRDPRTIWVIYNSVKTKKKLFSRETRIHIPLSIFRNRELSALEALVMFLKNFEMKYSEIARLINKDQRTVWTVHARAKNKLIHNKKHGRKK